MQAECSPPVGGLDHMKTLFPQIQPCCQLARDEASLDADPHVVACDGVDERRGQFRHEQRKASAEWLVDDEGVKRAHPFSELAELWLIEMMEEEIGDKCAASLGRGLGKKIALFPVCSCRETKWARGKIISYNRGVGMLVCDSEKQMPVTSSDLGDGSHGVWDHRHDPAFVAHEEVDAAEVTSGASRTRVIMRQMVEEFRGEFSHVDVNVGVARVIPSHRQVLVGTLAGEEK